MTAFWSKQSLPIVYLCIQLMFYTPRPLQYHFANHVGIMGLVNSGCGIEPINTCVLQDTAIHFAARDLVWTTQSILKLLARLVFFFM